MAWLAKRNASRAIPLSQQVDRALESVGDLARHPNRLGTGAPVCREFRVSQQSIVLLAEPGEIAGDEWAQRPD
jgi:hypothetical protein